MSGRRAASVYGPQVAFSDQNWSEFKDAAGSFYGGLTSEMPLKIFPEGLKSPAAVYCRAVAECGLSFPATGEEVVDFTPKARGDNKYEAGVGHCRAALMAFIACLVSISPEDR